MTQSDQSRILTGASAFYERSLLALIGSLNLNWPDHPPVHVFDLGMRPETCRILEGAGVEVTRVPEFCGHWRQHFTWKIWAIHNAPVSSYLWLDAGVCVLRPLPEAFSQIQAMGYFFPGNGFTLDGHVPTHLMSVLDLEAADLSTMLSINGGVHGISKSGKGSRLVDEAMDLARDERNLKASAPMHRHDQALLSLLAAKHFAPILYADGLLYACAAGPEVMNEQRIWVHRQRMLEEDLQHFIEHTSRPGRPYLPRSLPQVPLPSRLMRLRIAIARLRGRAPQNGSAGCFVYDGVRD